METIKIAIDLLSDPESWTQGAYARDSDGKTVLLSGVFSGAIQAKSFCLDGALCVAKKSFLIDEEAKALGFSSRDEIRRWNDAKERTYEDVIERLRSAFCPCYCDETSFRNCPQHQNNI